MSGVYELYIETHFSAAHALKGYQGDCARLHGHNWIIRVYVRCRKLDDIGIGIDFKVLKNHVKDALQELDHAHINDLPQFRKANPTSENIAIYLYGELGKRINTDSIEVSKIKVSETPNTGVFYWEE
jgi:6-pyruvoyltetrahydropterin/6-carboxytetrahydropterin synthase